MADETPMKEAVPENVSDVVSFDLPKKKKKKKKKIPHSSPYKSAEEFTSSLRVSNADEEEEEEEEELGDSRFPFERTEGDYGYEKLLGRVFSNLHKHNPELSENRLRTVLRPPEVLHEGKTKTVFANFIDLCKTMHRDRDHFMSFLQSQIGTSVSLDEQDLLVVKGRFSSKSIEVVLRKYIDEYVVCNTCKSPDTVLSHKDCIVFLGCEQCGSERRVSCG